MNTLQENARILVADDSLLNQRLVAGMLDKMGYRADTVSNGKEAISALQISPYSLVLMDCEMPEMDGYQAAMEIRKNENDGQHVFIIALTANSFNGDKEKCLSAGMDDYLSKPINQNELFSKLSSLVKIEESSKQIDQHSETSAKEEIKQSADARNISERLQELAEVLDFEEMSEIIDSSYSESEKCWQKLMQAKQAGDLLQLSREAHSMKGSYRNLGADILAQMFEQLEHDAKNMDANKLEKLLADTECAMKEVQDALGKEKERLSSSY